MRTHSTRAKPMSISRAVRNGNASFDRSARRQRLQQLARPRALHVELRVARRHVGDEGVRVAEVAAHPGLDVAVRGVGGDHPEPLVVELGDREVGLERAALVEPLRVGDHARARRRRGWPRAGSSSRPASRPCTRNFDMNDMSITITPSRAARCSACPVRRTSSGGPTTAGRRPASTPARRVPVGALPAADVPEVRAAAPPAGRASATRFAPRAVCIDRRRVVALVDHARATRRCGSRRYSGLAW